MYQFSDAEVRYAIQQLFTIAGLTLNEDSEMAFDRNASSVTISVWGNKQVVLKVMQQYEIEDLLKGELLLQIVTSFDSQVDIPLFITNNEDNFAAISNEKLIVHADIVTISFIMLSRYEETLTTERDHHNRYQYKNSLACKYGFIDIPIVDEYAMLLRMWLLTFIPTLEIQKRRGKVIPTHDIDGIRRFGNLFRNFQTVIGGDIIRRKSILIALKSFKQCLVSVKNKKKDPLVLAIELLINSSIRAGLCSEFYFMGLRSGQYDARYDILNPVLKYCINLIKDANMTIGMHGGYDSYDNEEIFKKEKENIESVYGKVIMIVRQHFLMFNINKTLQIWQNCKILKDSTLGYSEREGFRCGTCHEYFLYDLKNDCRSTVQEHPLIVMEKTLFGDSGHNIKTALSKIEKLYARCLAVEGDFVILWHNEFVFRDYEIRFREVYCKFLEKIS
jgi:hypothetical protein